MSDTPTHGITYLAKIVQFLGKLGQGETVNPDTKHNTGRLIGEAYLWDEVHRAAKGRAEKIWAALEKEGIIKKEERDPGEYMLAETPHFHVELKVSEKVRRFDARVLAKAMAASKFKVPMPIMLEAIEKAKVPAKSTNTYRITEKS